MIDDTKKYFFKRFLEDTLGYFSIYEFLKLRFKKTTSGFIEFKTAKDFWDGFLIDRKISNGQIVKLKDFYLSDFVPKLPGKLWTKESQEDIASGYKEVVATTADGKVNVLSLEGKKKIIEAGYGSVRLSPNPSGIYCSLLSCVSPDKWFVDAGIPIVVSKSVYDIFIKHNKQGAPWIEELEGVICLDQEVPLINKIPHSIGGSLTLETLDILTNSVNLPKCFIYVPSPLNIKLRTNNTHPDVVAWTTFKTQTDYEPLKYTYATFNPNKKGSLEYSIDFIKNYVYDFGGIEILTDFDGKIRRFNAKSDLSQREQLINSPVLDDMILTINKWIKY